MLRCCCEILIGTKSGTFKFTYVNEVKIESTWKKPTTTCVLKLARNLKFQDKRISDILSVDDTIEVKLGYDDNLNTEFKGYLTAIKPSTPIELQCQDEMYKLKIGSYTMAWKNATLDTVLQYILGGRKFETLGQINLGNFRISKASPLKVLQEIEKTYGLRSFFRGDTLIVGKPYKPDAKVNKYHFQKNVVSNSLEYKKASDIKIKVKAVSIQADGSKIEKDYGDDDGEERTLHFYKLSQKDMDVQAKMRVELLKYDGYRGKFVGFGLPVTQHGDLVDLDGVSHQLSIGEQPVSDYEGKYFVDGVNVSFGMDGFRRDIELGPVESQAMTSI